MSIIQFVYHHIAILLHYKFISFSISIFFHSKSQFRGTGVAQSVRHPTLDFGLGHDLRIVKSSPTAGSMPRTEPDLSGLDFTILRS